MTTGPRQAPRPQTRSNPVRDSAPDLPTHATASYRKAMAPLTLPGHPHSFGTGRDGGRCKAMNMMKMPGLRALYMSMSEARESRRAFEIRNGRARLRIIFLADDSPMALLISVIGKGFYFEREISKNFELNAYLGDDYTRLKAALDIGPDATGPAFLTSEFFRAIDREIPDNVSHTKSVAPDDIRPHARRRDVDEADKLYYLGLKSNGEGRRVTAANLKKTRFILGAVAHARCKRRNLSSCWTDRASEERPFVLPPE